MNIAALRALTAVLIGLAGATVYWSSGLLPEVVASNFGIGGRPTSFNFRDTYRAVMTVLTVLAAHGLPAMQRRALQSEP